jgi:hypothetical protein
MARKRQSFAAFCANDRQRAALPAHLDNDDLARLDAWPRRVVCKRHENPSLPEPLGLGYAQYGNKGDA